MNMKMAVIVVVLHPLTVVTWNYLPFQINGEHLVIVVVPMKVYIVCSILLVKVLKLDSHGNGMYLHSAIL
jgi:hypothetical protein